MESIFSLLSFFLVNLKTWKLLAIERPLYAAIHHSMVTILYVERKTSCAAIDIADQRTRATQNPVRKPVNVRSRQYAIRSESTKGL